MHARAAYVEPEECGKQESLHVSSATEMDGSLPIPAAIVGAGGYAGAELLRLLLGHGSARVVGLFASAHGSAGGDRPTPMGELFPRFRGMTDLSLLPTSVDAIEECGARAVFLATPHEVSHELAPRLAERGMVVFDLSAAFRLKEAGAYPRHYGFAHAHAAWLERAPYGLPELSRAGLREASLVAVPGCYPTSAILALAPLVRAGAVRAGTRPIIDSTSGVSGAGRAPSAKTHFCEVSLQPYGVLSHRHQPEIDAGVGLATLFTPHLGAFDRGILSTIHAELAAGWNEPRVRAVLESAYAGETFVRLLPAGQWPSVGAVRGTNFCDLGWAVDEQGPGGPHLIIVSALDNLVKGAAGQAVQCFNIRFGLPETRGLLG